MVKLTGIKTTDVKPVPEVVEALKNLLSLAESGDLRELSYCGITRHHKAIWDYMGELTDVNMMFTNLTHLTNNYYSTVIVEECDES